MLEFSMGNAERTTDEPRNADRLATPPCEHCADDEAVVCVLRTDVVVYFRCGQCARVWSVPKPSPL